MATATAAKNQQVGFMVRSLEDRVGFVHLSKAVLYAFPHLSDPARVTYALLRSLDYGDKGMIWWTWGRLAKIRRCSWQSIYWHLRELAHYQLLARQEDSGNGRPVVFELLPMPSLEVQRALFVRSYIDTPRSDTTLAWPDDFDAEFRLFAARTYPHLVGDFKALDTLKSEWKAIRQTVLPKSKRRPE